MISLIHPFIRSTRTLPSTSLSYHNKPNPHSLPHATQPASPLIHSHHTSARSSITPPLHIPAHFHIHHGAGHLRSKVSGHSSHYCLVSTAIVHARAHPYRRMSTFQVLSDEDLKAGRDAGPAGTTKPSFFNRMRSRPLTSLGIILLIIIAIVLAIAIPVALTGNGDDSNSGSSSGSNTGSGSGSGSGSGKPTSTSSSSPSSPTSKMSAGCGTPHSSGYSGARANHNITSHPVPKTASIPLMYPRTTTTTGTKPGPSSSTSTAQAKTPPTNTTTHSTSPNLVATTTS